MANNQIQIFANKEFGEIRVIEINGEPWWVLTDICKALDISNPSKVALRLDDDERSNFKLGRQGCVNIVNESGLYAVILRSDKPNAKGFRKWVTSEVLPTIRKHGGYLTDELLEKLSESEQARDGFFKELLKERREHGKEIKSFREAVADLKEDNELLETCVCLIAPKAAYCDIILECKNAIPVTIIAKDYGMAPAAFNRFLRDVGIQYKVGGCYDNSGTWVLYQKYSGCGFTETKTFRKAGKVIVCTFWTQSGRRMIYDVLKSYGIIPECEKNGRCGIC